MQHLDRPVVSPVTIGRAPHLDTFDRYLAQAVEGRGQTLLVAGEAGVGKSRLVAEARERAARNGMAVLVGHCFESHQNLPYAPLIDLLRGAGSRERARGSSERLAEAIGPAARDLARILPELAPRASGGAAPPEPEQSEQEKHRLFRALADGISRLAAVRPALVIVEDAHWSDDASLDFLADLARQIVTQPILLLVTYRDDEVSPALSKLLAGLDRQRLAAELRLARLGRVEVGEMMREIGGLARPVRVDFLDAIYALTDGNPFFIEEVLRALVAAGELDVAGDEEAFDRRPIGQLRVPRSVRDAVERRAARVSASGRRILSLAAVAGQRFDVELLEALTGDDEAALVEAIKELLAAGLVVEEADERFAFRHALTRAAVRAGLLTRERKAIHRAIGEAIVRLHGSSPSSLDAHAADLAYHFSEGEVWERTLRYAPRAGERAQALYAPRAAVEHFTRALEAGRRLDVEPSTQVLRARGQAYETLGEFEAARADFEAVLERARAVGDRHAEWQALVDLGGAWTSRSYERGGEYYGTALGLAREIGEGDQRPVAQTLNRIGNWHTNLEQPGLAVRHHREALALFRAMDDRRGIAETLDYLGMASCRSCGSSTSGTRSRRRWRRWPSRAPAATSGT
jgi:predicted ATPase